MSTEIYQYMQIEYAKRDQETRNNSLTLYTLSYFVCNMQIKLL